VFHVIGGPDYQAEDGEVSGGAQIQTEYIDLNEGNAAYGGFVRFPNAGAQLMLSGVQGGAGGATRVELRNSYPANSGSVNLTVQLNGQGQTVSLPALLGNSGDWRQVGIEGFTLNPGTGNTLTLTVGAAS
jgi:hypothetical protein